MSIRVDPDWWKRLFDEVYLVTDARTVCDEALTRREISLLCDMVPMVADHRVLDLCGGHGRHVLELSRRGWGHCVVLDFSHTLLSVGRERAREEGLPVTFIQGDARCLPMPPDHYHRAMILGNSLGYAGNSGSDNHMIKEAHRVLKSGGLLLLDVADAEAVRRHFAPNAWHEIGDDIVVCRQREMDGNTINARELVIHKTMGLVRDQTYSIRLYSADALMAMVADAGFSDANVHTDFSLQQSQGDLGFMNHRMIITAKKV